MKKGVHELSTAAFNARMTIAWLEVAKKQAPAISDELQSLLVAAKALSGGIANIFTQLAGPDHEHHS